MKPVKDVLIAGASNPELVRLIQQINDRVNEWRILGFLDDDLSKKGSQISGYSVLGPLALLQSEYKGLLVANNVAGTSTARKTVALQIEAFEAQCATMIHPGVDCRNVEIGEGTIIFEGCILSPSSKIGKHCLINLGAIVAHEAVLGDYATLAPACNITGRVRLGEGTYVGASAVVLPGCRIGAWSKIGAGSVVMRDVPENCTVFGNPARRLPDSR